MARFSTACLRVFHYHLCSVFTGLMVHPLRYMSTASHIEPNPGTDPSTRIDSNLPCLLAVYSTLFCLFSGSMHSCSVLSPQSIALPIKIKTFYSSHEATTNRSTSVGSCSTPGKRTSRLLVIRFPTRARWAMHPIVRATVANATGLTEYGPCSAVHKTSI